MSFIRFILKFWSLRKFTNSHLWSEAEKAVSQVIAHKPLNEIAQNEPKTSFCPRCGQIPDGDRRMDEARELIDSWTYGFKRSEVDFALSYWYFIKK